MTTSNRKNENERHVIMKDWSSVNFMEETKRNRKTHFKHRQSTQMARDRDRETKIQK